MTVYTSAEWCKRGKLDGVQVAPRGPWRVVLSPEIITALRQPVRQYKPRRAKAAAVKAPSVTARRAPKGSRS